MTRNRHDGVKLCHGASVQHPSSVRTGASTSEITIPLLREINLQAFEGDRLL
jgi:hypothetical protein